MLVYTIGMTFILISNANITYPFIHLLWTFCAKTIRIQLIDEGEIVQHLLIYAG